MLNFKVKFLPLLQLVCFKLEVCNGKEGAWLTFLISLSWASFPALEQEEAKEVGDRKVPIFEEAGNYLLSWKNSWAKEIPQVQMNKLPSVMLACVSASVLSCWREIMTGRPVL